MCNNLVTIKEYFKNCVDGKRTDLVGKYFAEDVLIHRPDCDAPLVGLKEFRKNLQRCVTDRYESIHTSFQKEVVSENGREIVVSLTHEAKGANTWKGCNVSGKNVSWTSLTYFRFNDEGQIVEEIVERNELDMAQQLGIVSLQ